MSDSKDTIIIYTDGACSNNNSRTNDGGWAAVLTFNGSHKSISGYEKNTTNQRMELTACIMGLKAIKSADYPVIIRSDSAYIVNCFHQKWFTKWRTNGWMNSKKEPVENRDLWEELIKLAEKFQVKFEKVKGHSGDSFNEMADKLAVEAGKKKS